MIWENRAIYCGMLTLKSVKEFFGILILGSEDAILGYLDHISFWFFI